LPYPSAVFIREQAVVLNLEGVKVPPLGPSRIALCSSAALLRSS
jgi:hypothetical protein